MTQRLLVTKYLDELTTRDPRLDTWIRTALRRHVASVFENMRFVLGSGGNFTAAVAGSATAGTYEIATQYSRYYRTGELVYATVDVTLAAAITGGGAGNLTLTGLPFFKQPNHQPVGSVYLSGVDLTPGVHAVCLFDSTADQSKTLVISEVNDNAAATLLAIGSVAANDRIIATIVYVASD